MRVDKENVSLKQRLTASQLKVQKLERDIKRIHYKLKIATNALEAIEEVNEYHSGDLAAEALEEIKNAKL